MGHSLPGRYPATSSRRGTGAGWQSDQRLLERDCQQPAPQYVFLPGYSTGTVADNSVSVWDYEIITKYMGDFNLENVDKWTKKITKELGPGGAYFWRKWDWVSCDDIDDAEVRKEPFLRLRLLIRSQCPLP